MARTFFRGVGGGRRRDKASLTTSALSALLLVVLMAGCNLNSPSSQNTPGDLTGQTPNQNFNFTGTVSVSVSSSSLTGDDLTTIVITANVRDSSGNPINNLTTVTFSTDLGGFFTPAGVSTFATGTTFNGVAQVLFQSLNRTAGTATIVASVGDKASATSVTIDPAPIEGTLSLAFGGSGTGAATMTGAASETAPLEVDISVLANDTSVTVAPAPGGGGGGAAPLSGGTIKFRIVRDTTTGSGNGGARFIAGDTAFTSSAGLAINRVRVVGVGDLIMVADLIDPNTNDVVATSNNIILVTSQGSGGPSISLTFSDGSSQQFPFGGAAPFTEGIQATVLDGTTPLVGRSVRFNIVSDTTGGATLSNGTTGPLVTTTNGAGQALNSITVTSPGQVVTLRAELLDASGAVVATSNDIIAIYD